MIRSRSVLGATLLAVAQLTIGTSQVRSEEAPLEVGLEERVEVELFQLNFLARDNRGRPVTDLRKEEIEIVDGGVRQQVALLESYHRPRPAEPAPQAQGEPAEGEAIARGTIERAATPGRWIVLLFDNYSASQGTKVRAASAAREFVKTRLAPGDRVAVISFTGVINVLQTFTGNRDELLAACAAAEGQLERATADRFDDLEQLLEAMETCRAAVYPSSCAQQYADSYEDGRYREADAILLALSQLVRSLAPIPDVKMLVLFSDGFARSPGADAYDAARAVLGFQMAGRMLHSSGNEDKVQRSFDSIAEAAAAARVSIFTIKPGGATALGSISAARGGFRNDALGTDQIDVHRRSEQNYDQGLAELSRRSGGTSTKNPDALEALQQVVDLSAGLYTVGYYPKDVDKLSRLHDVKIKIKRKGVRVETRREVPRPAVQPSLTGELTLTPDPCSDDGRRIAVLRLRLDRSRLMFEKVDKSYSNNFALFLRILPEGGSENIFEDYRYLNVTNSASEVAAGDLADPLVEQTLLVPCRNLIVDVTAIDAGSGARGEFTATLER